MNMLEELAMTFTILSANFITKDTAMPVMDNKHMAAILYPLRS